MTLGSMCCLPGAGMGLQGYVIDHSRKLYATCRELMAASLDSFDERQIEESTEHACWCRVTAPSKQAGCCSKNGMMSAILLFGRVEM